MNNFNIPQWLEDKVRNRDICCVYCGVVMDSVPGDRKNVSSWEHIENDKPINQEWNCARCCMSCNASKGTKPLSEWLGSEFCTNKGITKYSVAPFIKKYLRERCHAI